jgi:predicted metal-dependent peptidase
MKISAEHQARLEQENRERIAQQAEQVMRKAKMHIQVYHPFFGALLERLKIKSDARHPTIYTDAVVMGYNPAWVVSTPWDALLYNVAHLVAHCALRHPFRRGNREEKTWREATDHAANLMLIGDEALARMMPQPGTDAWCGDAAERFRGLAAEQIFSILQGEKPPQQSEEQDPTQEKIAGGTGGAGDCCDAGASGEEIPDEDNGEEKKDEGDGDDSNAQGKGKVQDDHDGLPGDGSTGDAQDPLQQQADSGGAGGDDPEDDQPGDADSRGDGDSAEDEHDDGGDGTDGDLEDQDDLDEGEQREAEGGVTTADEVEGEGEEVDPAKLAQMEREWAEAVTTAVLAAGGEMGAGMNRQVGAANEVRKSFEEYVDIFANKVFSDQESWKRPNRRFSDAYLPSHSAPSIRKVVAGVDTSGSITDAAIGAFKVALERIMEQFGCGVIVVFCDSRIRSVQEFARGESLESFEPAGGGGTRFAPVFDYALDLIEQGEEIAGVIYLTDLEGHLGGWQKYRDIETLWVSTEPQSEWYGAPPIGTVCSIHD